MNYLKKLMFSLLLVLLCVTLLGCKKTNNAYEQSISEAKKAISDQHFDLADIFLDEALVEQPDSEEAKIYQTQLKKYLKALELKENKEKEQSIIKLLDDVIEEVNGSQTLIDYAKEEKQVILSASDSESEEEFPDVEVALGETKKDLWSQEQSEELDAFVASWGKQMNQTYEAYDDKKSVDLYGINVPQVILDNSWKMVVNDKPVSVEWSTSGIGKTPYQLVAVYSDADYQPNLEKHVYFFVLVDNEPKVFVTQQNQGNPQNYLYFDETQNVDLLQAFRQIAKQEEYSF